MYMGGAIARHYNSDNTELCGAQQTVNIVCFSFMSLICSVLTDTRASYV